MRFPHLEVKRMEGKKILYWLVDHQMIIIDPGRKNGNIHFYKHVKTINSCGLRSELERYLHGEELSNPSHLIIQEIIDDMHNLKMSIFQDKLMLKGLWIETCGYLFPDFIACDGGDRNYNRSPERRYISIKQNIEKLSETNKRTKGSLWNAFASEKFFKIVQTTQFSNISAFKAYYNDEEISVMEFRDKWERKVKELIEA